MPHLPQALFVGSKQISEFPATIQHSFGRQKIGEFQRFFLLVDSFLGLSGDFFKRFFLPLDKFLELSGDFFLRDFTARGQFLKLSGDFF